MNKFMKILALLLVFALVVPGLVACGTTPTPTPTPDPTPDDPDTELKLEGTYDITMWVSEIDGVDDQFMAQIAAFNAAYAEHGIVINAQISGVSEGSAAGQVIADVASAPDIYCFAQDQLVRLVQAGALAAPFDAVANRLKDTNDAGSVAAGSVAGKLYAYPMTSDNGYYMYYDTSLITPEDAESMEKLIEICEQNGKKFRFALENGWYTASFFFATGCETSWTVDQDGKFTGVNDTFNSAAGLAAMKGMQTLSHSTAYDSNADIFTDAAVIVTGVWNANAALEHFGANLGATDLPSFTVDGNTYHLGSFTGNKLMGVKPQNDVNRTAVLALLAEYLTNEENQTQRFETFGWGPSNLAAQASEAVQANLSLAALAKQAAYGKPQGQVNGSWWDMAAALGAQAKAATTDAELQQALTEYAEALQKVLSKSDEELAAWGVIGGVCGTSWDTDIAMTKVGDNTWETAAIQLNAGEQFKLRQGGGWNVQVGVANEKTGETETGFYARLQDGADEPGNIVVEATGTYIVRLVWDGTHLATVTLVPVE